MIKTNEALKIITKSVDREYMNKSMHSLFPLLSEEPIDAAAFYEAIWTKPQETMELYTRQRIRVKGIASFVGIDIHGLPSVQLSDRVDGENMVLCVFNQEEILTQVKTGDAVTIEANFLHYHEEFGIVLKNSQLIS